MEKIGYKIERCVFRFFFSSSVPGDLHRCVLQLTNEQCSANASIQKDHRCLRNVRYKRKKPMTRKDKNFNFLFRYSWI